MTVRVACVLVVVGLLCGCSGSSKEDVLKVTGGVGSSAGDSVYEKPEGVDFHIPAILGPKYSTFRGSAEEVSLGARLGVEKLPGIRGRAIQYAKGRLLVARDIIYGVEYHFPVPVGRIEAIHRTGLPESLNAEFKPTAREQRIEYSAYGYRRIVLRRDAPWQEEFTRIAAWKFLPQERF